MIKELDGRSIKKFLEIDFNNDSEIHNPEWYLERVPSSFYVFIDENYIKDASTLDKIATIINKDKFTSCEFHGDALAHGIYCKPYWDWIEPLADYLRDKKVLDVMAGSGLISMCLKYLGIDIDACDRATGEDNEYVNYRCWDFPIISGEKYIEEQAKKDIIYDTILMIWPEFNGDGTDKKICDVFLNSNPNGEIIFIGEDDMGGCTGSKALFEAYKFEEIVELDKYYIPDWGYHDGIFRATKIAK